MLATLGFSLLLMTSYNAMSAFGSRQEEHLRNKVYAQLEVISPSRIVFVLDLDGLELEVFSLR